MSAYEASLASADSVTAKSNDPKPEQSSDKLARELVVDLVDDISTGAEIATITDNMLGVFKSHLSIQSLTFCRDITAAMASYANSTAEKNALQLVVTFSRAINRKFVGLGETSTESDQCSSERELATSAYLVSTDLAARNFSSELDFDLDSMEPLSAVSQGSIGEGNIGHIASAEEGDDSALQLQNQAISTILAMARSAMDASGHAHLISRDQRTRMLSMDNGGWEQDESTEEASPMKAVLTSPSNGESNDKQVSQPSSPTGAKHHSELRRQSNRKYGDLHNPQVKKNKMSKEQFVKNNRGIDNGKDLPKRFLEEIYDDIAHNPMHIKGSRVIPKATREASVTAADLENEKFRGGIAKAVAQSEELMKDLSHAYNTFQFVGVDTPISPDLIKILFERVWFSLLTLSTTILCDNQSDLSTRMQCLDLLRFGISTCLFLSMPVERQAFCGTPEDTKYDWVRTIEEAAGSDDPWKAMGDIHLLVNDMKETIQVRQKSEKLDSVIQRIHRGHFYLKNSTTFIHEGDLTKKCRSRHQLYRFFLFNDQLLYADKSMSGRWSPHNFLRLKLTRISNIPDGVMSKNAFQIQNPIKSFVVFADSAGAKAEWMRLIDEAIAEASKKINRTARRISTHGLAASTASSARKVFMRFSSPMTSPTAERDSTNTSSASEGDSPVKPQT
uniref:PH domain-containing protein n=1 Tax=Phytophthora ramorum TaxID=164328 RepID=H3HCN0_PHYRM